MEASFEQARMKAYWRACFISVDLRRTVKNAACKRRFFVSEIVPELDGAGIKLVLCHVTLNGLSFASVIQVRAVFGCSCRMDVPFCPVLPVQLCLKHDCRLYYCSPFLCILVLI